MAALMNYYVGLDSIIIKSEKVTQVKDLRKNLVKFENQSKSNVSVVIGSKGDLESREIAGANKG
jgi:accessory colonization factor AcfC